MLPFCLEPYIKSTCASLTTVQITSNAGAALFVVLYLAMFPQLPNISSSPNKAMYMHIETGWIFSCLLLCLMNRLLMTNSRTSMERKKKCIFRSLKGKCLQWCIFSTSNPLLLELRFAKSYVVLGPLIFCYSEALQFSWSLDHTLGVRKGSKILSKTISSLQSFKKYIKLVLKYTSVFHFLCFNMQH